MEDLIDIRNKKEHTNIVKWYNYNYEEKKNLIGEEGNEIYLPMKQAAEESEETVAEKDPVTSYAEDVLSKINQARDDKVLAAIMQGREE